jgi:dihydroxy-acid dehydratase
MPEWGQLPIPKKILETGVRDMLRISDARMSGTSYGACVLHVRRNRASAVRWPCRGRRHDRARRAGAPPGAQGRRRRARAPPRAWQRPAPKFERGFGALYQQHITQADQGCDFDFLEGTAPTPDPEIH